MQLKIKTATLKSMVNKAVKCSPNNKMIPLTGLMSIDCTETGKVSITTSDAVNYFTVFEDTADNTNFSVVVNTDLFSKLISKTTSETVTLELNDLALSFKGNGTYKIDLPLDETGKPVKFPTITTELENSVSGIIKKSIVSSIIQANKPALAVTMERAWLTGYYCTTDNIIASDSFTICVNNVKTFPEEILISPIIFDLLNLSESEDIEYNFTKDLIIFKTDKLRLVAKPMRGAEKYPLDIVNNFASLEFTSSCTVSKTALINILDRLSLFISDFDINGVYLDFTNDGVIITSTRKNASELIPYKNSTNFSPYSCLVNVDFFKKQISARSGDLVNIQYGHPDTLKIVDNTVTQIIALLEYQENEV